MYLPMANAKHVTIKELLQELRKRLRKVPEHLCLRLIDAYRNQTFAYSAE